MSAAAAAAAAAAQKSAIFGDGCDIDWNATRTGHIFLASPYPFRLFP